MKNSFPIRNFQIHRWIFVVPLLIFFLGYLCLFFYRSQFELEKSEVGSEIQKFRKQYKYLWRTAKNTINNKDKVQMLEQWTKELTNSEHLKGAKEKKILLYDTKFVYYGRNLSCPFLTQEEQSLLQSKCIVDQKRNKTLKDFPKQDAVIIVRDWRGDSCNYGEIKDAETVYFIEESPNLTKCANFSKNNPILGSYWGGSDIVIPYGYFTVSTKINNFIGINYAKKKDRLVAILMSNCGPANNRIGFVNELKKYIPVSFYGRCGQLKCRDCPIMIQHFKFYLAFENANCRDYITEKFWTNGLANDVVPVVMGAHPDDYKRLAPPNSYIHVEDFNSPKELAQYLLLLDKNDELYNKYFEYKRFGSVQLYRSLWDQFLCRLCSLLHFQDILPRPAWPQENIVWNKKSICLPPKQWYWNNSEKKL